MLVDGARARGEMTARVSPKQRDPAAGERRPAGARRRVRAGRRRVERAARARLRYWFKDLAMNYKHITLASAAVARRCSVGRPSRVRDFRAGAREGEWRDLHEDAISKTRKSRRSASAGQQIDPKTDPSNAAAPQGARRSHAADAWSMPSTRCSSCSAARSSATSSATSSSRASLDSIKKENKIETDEQFQAALKQENMTMADLRRNLERTDDPRSASQQNEVLGKVGVTDDEARKYYDAHRSEFTTPPTDFAARDPGQRCRTMPKGVNVAVDEQAQARAEDIRARASLAGEASTSLRRTCPTRRPKPTPA